MKQHTKICKKCLVNKPTKLFVKNKNCKSGTENTCIECCRTNKNNWRKRNKDRLSKKRRIDYSKLSSHITTKKCSTCYENQFVDNFWKSVSSGDGFQSRCKNCCKLTKKVYYKNLPLDKKHRILAINRSQINKDRKRLSGIKYRNKHMQIISDKNKEWRIKNRDILANKRKLKYKTDVVARLLTSLRNRQNRVLCGQYSTTKGLGCNSIFFRNWIEDFFSEGMTWNNRWRPGKCSKTHWSLDHKIPLNIFMSSDESMKQKILHYTNIFPMWHFENISKGAKYQK